MREQCLSATSLGKAVCRSCRCIPRTLPPIGGVGGRGVAYALGIRSRHMLPFRRCLVCMAPLGSSLDDLKFSIDDPAVFLESQYPSDDDCLFFRVRRLSSTVHRVTAAYCLTMLSLS